MKYIILLMLSTLILFGQTIDVQRYKPSLGLKGMFVTNTSETLDPLNFGGMLMIHYDKDPLVSDNNGIEETLVGNVFYGDLMFGMGIIKNLEFGLDLPLSLYSSGTNPADGGDFSKFSIGDLRLGLKYVFKIKNLGMGAVLNVTMPTGDKASFNTADKMTFFPELLVDYQINQLLLAFNIGYLIKDEASLGNVKQGQELSYKIGAKYTVMKELELLTELFGAFQSKAPFEQKEETPLELLFAANYYFLTNVKFSGGAAMGLSPGVGTPLFRIIAGAGYVQRDPDKDKDGILNADDKCPDKAEDFDGFEDTDGCPELDNDKDGILDGDDQCKNEAEDKDGFEDLDGCPDLDNDKDGIVDAKDKCPNEAEDFDGFEDEDGCPDLDNDSDGILDADDKCINEAETVNGINDEDGCPEKDTDGDGIVDDLDKCPNDAEDKDGFEDEDGCPDLDNDKDGIPDDIDQCKNEAEVYNGNEDTDGCPDEGKELVKINLTTQKLDIKEVVYFDTGSAKISQKSFKLLKTLASSIKNSNFSKITIEGHTDDVGKEETNTTLSQDRANSVLEFLAKEGIAKDKLEAKGYGPTKPLVEVTDLIEKSKDTTLKAKEKKEINKSLKDARDKNRRVEFIITD